MSIIVFDTETTSLLAPQIAGTGSQPHLIDFYGIKLDPETGGRINTFHFTVKPPVSIPEDATRVNGFTDESVATLKPFAAYWRALANWFIGSTHCVGHNLMYDKSVIYYELTRIGKQMNFPWPPGAICTVEEIQKIKGYRMSLMDLYVELMGEVFARAHSAGADAEATAKVFSKMVEKGMIKI